MISKEAEHIFNNWVQHDKSFLEKPHPLQFFFGSKSYDDLEVRKIWHDGVKVGIEMGLHHASLEGRKVQLNDSAISTKNKNFIEKHQALCYEYGCAIQYNASEGGMCIVDVDWGKPIKRLFIEDVLKEKLDAVNDKLNLVMDTIKKQNPELYETLLQNPSLKDG